jgi:hypothetical protein
VEGGVEPDGRAIGAAVDDVDGDRLLCFGRLEEMRDLIPQRKKRPTRVRKLPKVPIRES